jgi:hypothetical protein
VPAFLIHRSDKVWKLLLIFRKNHSAIYIYKITIQITLPPFFFFPISTECLCVPPRRRRRVSTENQKNICYYKTHTQERERETELLGHICWLASQTHLKMTSSP